MQHVFSLLPTADLGNCAQTCTRLRGCLHPVLASQLNRLMLADDIIVKRITPDQPEAYGIIQQERVSEPRYPDMARPERLGCLAIRDKLDSFAKELYACPALAKYVKHVFVDYRLLVDEWEWGGDVCIGSYGIEHAKELMRLLALRGDSSLNGEDKSWYTTCGLAAVVLMILFNMESLVLLSCNSFGFDFDDPITTTLVTSLSPGCRQTRFRRLKHVYASGWRMHDQNLAPWGPMVLPSIETFECDHAGGPLPIMPQLEYNKDECFHTQRIGQASHYDLYQYMPRLKRLIYQCIPLNKDLDSVIYRGLHIERFGRAIQCLSHTLEELVVEVDRAEDLWGFTSWDREDDADFASEGFGSDADTPSSCEEDINIEAEETDLEKEIEMLDIHEDLDELRKGLLLSTNPDLEENLQSITTAPSEAILGGFHLGQPVIREPTWDDHHPEFLGSLSMFTKLRVITIPAVVLQDPWPLPTYKMGRPTSRSATDWTSSVSERRHLKDLLPTCIERVTLLELGSKRLPNLEQDIEEVRFNRESLFPNFISIERSNL
ncbi:MAG: hypothetical protein Q9195_004778 [Heterodermia aff. obscurata]